MLSASARRQSGENKEFTNPHLSASNASNFFAVKMSSLARATPTKHGKAAAPTTSPYSAPGNLKVANSDANRMSQEIASAAPPP